MQEELRTDKFYINGSWVTPQGTNQLDVYNPDNGAVSGTIALGNDADVDIAVAAAREAFKSWSVAPKERKLQVLHELAQSYEDLFEDMVEAISLEMGAPARLSRLAQAPSGSEHIANTIEVLNSFDEERKVSGSSSDRLLYEAIGVAALITPWNWPISQIMLKVAPAIAAGCSVVLKPSEVAPYSGLVFANMVARTSLPAGVFNLINGDGATVGSYMARHPLFDMVSFTGSTRAGVEVTRGAAPSVKRVSLELGGKGANIIFADARSDAVGNGIRRCFNNTGQSCNAPTRMLIEESRYDRAIDEATEAAAAISVDRPGKDGNHIGPLVSQLQWDKVQRLIQSGIDEGARLLVGGVGKPEGLEDGYYVRPTVFADVTPEMTIAREEIFGPVLSMIKFRDEEEAIAIANDTEYGLTNYVESEDAEQARRVARAMRSGMVEINGIGLSGNAPFGGYKMSGNGRESGELGLEEYLEIKAVGGWQ